MRRLNSDLSSKLKENVRNSYLEIFAVAVIQFLLSILILCYGVYLMQMKDFCNLKTGLWTAVLYVASFKITNPWVKSYCKYLYKLESKVQKKSIALAVFFLFFALLSNSFYFTPSTNIILYGVFGGICTSVIYTFLKYATIRAFNNNLNLFEFLDQLVKSFCLLITPHLVLLFINLYGTGQSLMILAAILLNIIPLCFLIKTRFNKKVQLCKFQTLETLSIEMSDFNLKQPVVEEASKSDDEASLSEEEESFDVEAEEVERVVEKPAPLPLASIEKYFKSVGVNILPYIPEEDVTDEEDDINEISSKRLSKISAILQEINDNSPKRSLSSTNLFHVEETETVETPDENFQETSLKKSKCCSINSSVVFDLKLKKKRLRSFCYESFVRLTFRCLKTKEFYPAVLSSSIITLLSTIILASIPHINNNRRHTNYPTTPEESAFLLTVIGFAWLFLLAGYPVFNKLSAFKTKVFFLAGLMFLGLSLYFVYHFSYDNFIFFSLTFGVGYGIVTYSENLFSELVFGKENFKFVQGPLEVTTGIIVILIYLAIYFSNLEIQTVLYYGYWFYLFDVILWIAFLILKKFM